MTVTFQVNDEDVSTASHEQAIRLLKTSPDPLTLLVRHEPPPQGLLELTLVTKPGEGFGFSISGGVNGYPGNPLDETDEGIFISEVSLILLSMFGLLKESNGYGLCVVYVLQ